MMLSSVDLPTPDSPMMAMYSPALTVSRTCSNRLMPLRNDLARLSRINMRRIGWQLGLVWIGHYGSSRIGMGHFRLPASFAPHQSKGRNENGGRRSLRCEISMPDNRFERHCWRGAG